MNPKYGVKITATNHETNNEIATTENNEKRYSPVVELFNQLKTLQLVISVPDNIGNAVDV